MSEHDNNDPVEPDPAATDQPAADVPAAPPTAEAKPRWRDRVFRMRAVAAVAVAALILGAAGGSVTTALVSGDDHGDRDDRHRIGPGMPAVPPDGRLRFPGQGSEDGELPEMPVPPDSSDSTDEESSLSQS